MAKITSGATFGLTAPQTRAARLLAEGKTEDEVTLILWGAPIDPDTGMPRERTPSELGAATKRLRKMMRAPGFADCYRAIVAEQAFSPFGAATRELVAQLKNGNVWARNKACNDIIALYKPIIMGSEDREIVVKVEGMPPLGMPSSADDVPHIDAAGDVQ